MKIFTEYCNPVEGREVEFVEAKGLGHPDSICDAVCEECGRALDAYYRKRFGKVMHYNIDKALLVAGSARPKFGGGSIRSPVKLIIAGRVTDKVRNASLPVRKLIKDTALRYLKQFRIAKFKVIVDVKSAAENLAEVSASKAAIANDTSFGASHYPLSGTEELVLEVCEHLTSASFRKAFPAAGHDVKVMGIRAKEVTELTIAIAMVSKHIADMDDYIETKEAIAEHLLQKFGVPVCINTLDDIRGGVSSIYLTVSGLSAEMGDDGQVGRGNRCNGLITPGRAMSIEAVAGKNPRHPGRSYQLAANAIAKALVETLRLARAEVQLVTDIGSPLDDPRVVYVRANRKVPAEQVEKIVHECIRKIVR
ncbi:methionine adenosyltransferase [Candidatus Woesearchaeota archaeon]|nr:methionine adenosyltransferase [Candidatus Woesearchaeota archaeon]